MKNYITASVSALHGRLLLLRELAALETLRRAGYKARHNHVAAVNRYLLFTAPHIAH
jgi:hypothetical protein